MTPRIEGIKGRTIETPKGGWAVNSWYIAEVSAEKKQRVSQNTRFLW